jgi:hypothetical protein
MADEHGDLDRFIVTGDDITVHHKAGKSEAGGNVHVYHGTPGDPGYPALHPKSHKGRTKTANGGVLGSDRFTEEEHKAAADEYLFEAYAMNEWLRHHKVAEGTPNDEEDLDSLNSRLMDLIEVQEPSTEDEVFYRGLQDPYSFADQLKRGAFQMKKGDEFHDRGFVSTSERREVADKFRGDGGFIMQVTVPKGTRYLNTDKTIHDKPQWERERILMPGTRFRFTGYVGSAFDNPPVLGVEVIPA